MSEKMKPNSNKVRNSLLNAASKQGEFACIPGDLARSLRHQQLTPLQMRQGFTMIRDWVRYAKENHIPDDVFAFRHHIPRFAAIELGQEDTSESLQATHLDTLVYRGKKYADIISSKTDPAILSDPDIAIVGGAARLALKIHAGVAIESELPIHDIDAVISSDAENMARKADEYEIELSGMTIVDGDITTRLSDVVTKFDCTMNQVAVYDGKLFYTQSALDDIKNGTIRIIAKEDPLFGPMGVVLPEGESYIFRRGLYRGLCFLIREKGKKLVISQENIDREKDSIGRYWQVLLFAKLLTIKDDTVRYNAIGNWHEIAKRIGSTQSADPQTFLRELVEKYPGTAVGRNVHFDNNAQARWIIGKMISRGVEELFEKETFVPPETYTQADLSLPPSFPDYDYTSFMEYIDSIKVKKR